MDLSGLKPAPWDADCEDVYYDTTDAKGRPDSLHVAECRDAEHAAFIALARNAFDVMMRRGWFAEPHGVGGEWRVSAGRESGGAWLFHSKHDGYFLAADPFTALVEADAWYKANIERAR